MDDARFDRVLVLAPVGRDGPATVDLLGRADVPALVCQDYARLLEQVRAGAGAVFVAEEGLYGNDLAELASWVEQQAAWSDLPFVLLTSRHDEPRIAAWRGSVVARLGNVALLERPVQPLTLVSVLQSALRARGRQQEVRTLLDARKQAQRHLEALVDDRTSELQKANAQLRAEMAERARAEESLRHAQKLEALGQLTGGVAHDFNNLLMVITGGLDMIERMDDPQRRSRMLHRMRQAAQRGAGLTRQLLAFSRSHALRPERVDLSRQLREMRELLDRSLGGDVQVEVRLAADLWPVQVDAGELELALLNLSVNARDAMAHGGVVTVSGSNCADFADGELAGDFVRLSVSDTGDGMSEEVKRRVFEPFFTTKDVGKGSGLGLAQVYGFARQSGGTVQLESTPGVGSSVSLLLPRAHADQAVESDPAPRDRPTAQSGCVLLVEDDPQVSALVTDMLEVAGFSVLRAESADAALDVLGGRRAVDFLLSDIMMPGGTSGMELARQVRAQRPDLPILLSSGFAEPNRVEAGSLGIQILPKPYTLQELESAMARTRAGLVQTAATVHDGAAAQARGG